MPDPLDRTPTEHPETVVPACRISAVTTPEAVVVVVEQPQAPELAEAESEEPVPQRQRPMEPDPMPSRLLAAEGEELHRLVLILAQVEAADPPVSWSSGTQDLPFRPRHIREP